MSGNVVVSEGVADGADVDANVAVIICFVVAAVEVLSRLQWLRAGADRTEWLTARRSLQALFRNILTTVYIIFSHPRET